MAKKVKETKEAPQPEVRVIRVSPELAGLLGGPKANTARREPTAAERRLAELEADRELVEPGTMSVRDRRTFNKVVGRIEKETVQISQRT